MYKVDQNKNTALTYLMAGWDVKENRDKFRKLLTYFPKMERHNLDLILNLRNVDGFTPLHCAVCTEDPQLVRTLLIHGADPAVTLDNGQTALHFAAEIGMDTVIAQFCKHISPEDRKNTLHHPKKYRVPQSPDLADRDDNTVLHTLMGADLSLCTPSSIRSIVTSLNLDVNATNRCGLTPLMIAAHGNNISGVRALLELDADITIIDSKGKTVHDICRNETIAKILAN